MSDTKKDDHVHGGEKKKSPVQTLLMIAGIMLAVYLFLIFTGFGVPSIVDAFGVTVGETGKALSRLGAYERTLAQGISDVSSGGRIILIQLLIILFVVLILKGAADWYRGGKKKDDGGHPPGGHH